MGIEPTNRPTCGRFDDIDDGHEQLGASERSTPATQSQCSVGWLGSNAVSPHAHQVKEKLIQQVPVRKGTATDRKRERNQKKLLEDANQFGRKWGQIYLFLLVCGGK